MSKLLIALDADDTLWHNEYYYRLTEARFSELLADFAEADHLSARLLEAEKRNLDKYGFGIKGFTLSMIETAIEVTEARVPAETVQKILVAGREMLEHPVETLPYVEETLETLAERHLIVLVTKGDLFDQERKLASSGLGPFFDAVEIVSDKNVETYERVFSRYGRDTAAAMMVGNSLKSDVLPAIQAGGWGIYVPHELTWALERAEPPSETERFRQIDHLGQLEMLIAEIR